MKCSYSSKLFALCGLSVFLCSCGYFAEVEEPITFNQLPENIQSLATTEIGENQILRVEKEQEFGSTVYAIKYLVESTIWELEYNEEGKLLEKEAD